MLSTYIALLRGINVGGKNKLVMPDLAAIFAEAGCTAVQTYIQSGNIIFRASPEVADTLPAQIPALIAERFGLRIPVVLRIAEQLAETFRSNPFLAQNLPAETLHVMFLADTPTAEQVATLDPNRSAPDAFINEISAGASSGVSAGRSALGPTLQISAPKRAEKSKTGNGASTGE